MPDNEPLIDPDVFELEAAKLLAGQSTGTLDFKDIMFMSIAISLKRISQALDHQNKWR